MAHVASKPAARSRSRSSGPHHRLRWPLAAGLLVVLTALWLAADWWFGIPAGAQAAYVGRQTCIECHRQEWLKFEHSHHDLAMDRATPETVLGDFNSAELTHHGVTSRMFRRDGRFFIETEGPDGKPGEFEIKYVLGVTPLQQYMVEFDRPADMPENEIARLQVLRVSWDAIEKKWFHLDAPDVKEKLDPDDDLHWTGIAQRWNTMCADCHSTNLQKNFDAKAQTYHTTFAEIDVSCESCHGPGSHHVKLARQISPFWDREQGYALARIKGQPAAAEVESCAPCHSRRSTIAGGFSAGCNFHDFYASEVLSEATYHADGQILDEVYEYGSFLQSKMFHKQVRCTDCHDPHSVRLKFAGNQVCTSCHQHPAAKYDAVAHHNHAPNTAGSQCIDCHMPVTTYMDVDPRRDHSFRIPRPDLSIELGTPNACTGCHVKNAKMPKEQWPQPLASRRGLEYADWLREARAGNLAIKAELNEIDRWAERKLQEWFPRGPKREPHFAPALAAARRQLPDAPQQLIELLADPRQPAVARATAATELGAYVHAGLGRGDRTIAALTEALADRDPQVRAAAAASLQDAPSGALAAAVIPLLKDPLRLVRTRAAFTLSRLPPDRLRRDEPIWMKKAIEELLAGAMFDNDRAASHLLRGTVLENQGQLAQAQDEYEAAVRLEPFNVAPKSSLARLLDQFTSQEEGAIQQALQARDRAGAERHAQRAAAFATRFAELKAEEWSLLERDARLVPDNAALQLQAGLARYHQGWKREAANSFATAQRLAPRNPTFSYYLAIYCRDTGRLEEARELARRLVELRPKHPEYEQLLAELQASGQ